MGIGWDGKSLKEMLKERDRLIEQTGRYYGIEELKLRKENPLKFETLYTKLHEALLSARDSAKYIAASPVIRQGGEYIVNLHTPEGDTYIASVGLQYHIIPLPEVIRKMIELDYEEDPGIVDGRVFFNNDPYLAGAHPADFHIAVPVFYGDEIVAWITGFLMTLEVGAVQPGPLAVWSSECFTDGERVCLMHVGDNYNLRKDFLWHISRNTRWPDLWILDIKTLVSAASMAAKKIKKIIDEFGIDYYKQAIREIIEEYRRLFQYRIKERTIPGRFRCIAFRDLRFKESPPTRPLGRINTVFHIPTEITIYPEGKIFLDYEGLSPWGFHGFNGYPAAVEATTWSMYTSILAYDGKLNYGAYFQTESNKPYGSLFNPAYPYAGSTCPWTPGVIAASQIVQALIRGLLARGYVEEVFLQEANFWALQIGGILPDGIPYGTSNFEQVGCVSSGARAYMDGIDLGFTQWNPEVDTMDVEENDIICTGLKHIYRGYYKHTYGFGKYRGGCGWLSTLLVHGAGMAAVNCTGGVPATTTYLGIGFSGGYPAPGNVVILVRDTNVKELIEKGIELPRTPDQLFEYLEKGILKAREVKIYKYDVPDTEVKDYDLIYQILCGGGGYGDVLERDPELVKRDIEMGILDREVAKRVYGVVVNPSDDGWSVDYRATEKLRKDIREQRLREAVPFEEFWKKEREELIEGVKFNESIERMYKDCFNLSEKFFKEFKEFWQLPEDWSLE